MSGATYVHNQSVPSIPFEKLEPEIEQYLQRLFTSTELDVLQQVWDKFYDTLITEKYLAKFFHINNQKFENITSLNPSLHLQFTPSIAVHSPDILSQSEIPSYLEALKLKFVTQCFSPFSFILSGILGNSIQPSNLGFSENLFSSIGNEINPLGIPTHYGDIKFSENANQNAILSLLGIGVCHKASDASKNNIILLISDRKEKDYATWTPEATAPNLFFQIRLKQFIQEANQSKIQIFKSFQYKSGLYASAFMFAHFLQKGIVIESEEIAPHYNQLLISCDAGLMEHIDVIADKWNIEYTRIGKLIHEPTFKVKVNKHESAELPLHVVSILLKNIEVPDKPGNNRKKHEPQNINHLKEPGDYRDTAWNLITNANLRCKDWLTEKFDSTIGTNNIYLNFPASSRILNIKGTETALAISAFNRPSYFRTDPEKGANIAIAELTRKIACSGGTAKVITPCFLLPYSFSKEEVDKLQHIIKGLYAAARYFSLQISAPSVNFVESSAYPNLDLPIVNLYCTGVITDKKQIMTIAFKNKGDMIYLIGKSVEDLQSSYYLRTYFQVESSLPPKFDMQDELNLQDCVKKLIHKNLIRSANDVSMGGLFKTLTDSAITRDHGFDITTDAEVRKDAFLFGEAQSRIIVSVTPHRETEFIDTMLKIGVPFSALGHVTKEEIRVDDISYGFVSDFQKEYLTSPK